MWKTKVMHMSQLLMNWWLTNDPDDTTDATHGNGKTHDLERKFIFQIEQTLSIHTYQPLAIVVLWRDLSPPPFFIEYWKLKRLLTFRKTMLLVVVWSHFQEINCVSFSLNFLNILVSQAIRSRIEIFVRAKPWRCLQIVGRITWKPEWQ